MFEFAVRPGRAAAVRSAVSARRPGRARHRASRRCGSRPRDSLARHSSSAGFPSSVSCFDNIRDVREFLLVVHRPDARLRPPAPEISVAVARLRSAPRDRWRGAGGRARRSPRAAGSRGLPLAAAIAASTPARLAQISRFAAAGAWLATPLHLVAGLDTLHLPRDGILSLSPEDRSRTRRQLHDGARRRWPRAACVSSGDALLLSGLVLPEVWTFEPSRCLGADLVRVLPAGPGAGALRRLMAEIEMWLHEHPVNRRRELARRRVVRSLWLWGRRRARHPQVVRARRRALASGPAPARCRVCAGCFPAMPGYVRRRGSPRSNSQRRAPCPRRRISARRVMSSRRRRCRPRVCRISPISNSATSHRRSPRWPRAASSASACWQRIGG